MNSSVDDYHFVLKRSHSRGSAVSEEVELLHHRIARLKTETDALRPDIQARQRIEMQPMLRRAFPIMDRGSVPVIQQQRAHGPAFFCSMFSWCCYELFVTR